MSLFFCTIMLAVIAQRLVELRLARRNARMLKALGGIEVGQEHYRYVIYLHVMFFVCLIVEASFREQELGPWQWCCFLLFLVAQVARYWCIKSLGMFWNTRVVVLPGARPVRKGPYRYMRHPNYWVVGAELLLLPLVFSAYLTALCFPLLHLAFLLHFRLPVEEKSVYRQGN